MELLLYILVGIVVMTVCMAGVVYVWQQSNKTAYDEVDFETGKVIAIACGVFWPVALVIGALWGTGWLLVRGLMMVIKGKQ